MILRHRDIPFILLIGGIIAYGFALAFYTVSNSDVFGLVTLYGDDAFYYFQIARNMAEGQFSSFDGGITRTNGYHPLWMFLLVPFFLVFDAESALFAIKFFETLVLASGIALIVLAARLARLPWPPLVAAPLAIFPQRSFLIGMEPAFALLMLSLLFVALALWARDRRMAAPVAAILFLLPWARLEYAAISVTVAAVLFVIENSWRRTGFGARLVPMAGALCGFAAYLAYNQLLFGGAVPVSGAVKHTWSQDLWEASGGFDLAQNFLLASRERWVDNLAALAVCAAAVPVWRWARRSDSAENRLFVVFYAGVLALAVEHLAKLAQNVLFMHANFGIYTTYFVPGDLMMPLLAAVVWKPVAGRVARIADARRFGVPAAAAASVAVSVGAAFALHAPFQRVAEARDDPVWKWTGVSWAGAMIMNRVLPEGSVVGAWDSGVLGYFSRFPVVNLDGLVNSWDYLRAGGASVPKMTYGEPQRVFGLTYLANALQAPRDRLDNAVFVGAPHPAGDFNLVSVEPSPAEPGTADPQTAFWAKMEPHFLYRRDGAGVVADGRVLQAFFRDCDPEELRGRAFEISRTWEGGETRARLWRPGKDARRNGMGLCAAVLALPGKDGGSIRVTEPAGR